MVGHINLGHRVYSYNDTCLSYFINRCVVKFEYIKKNCCFLRYLQRAVVIKLAYLRWKASSYRKADLLELALLDDLPHLVVVNVVYGVLYYHLHRGERKKTPPNKLFCRGNLKLVKKPPEQIVYSSAINQRLILAVHFAVANVQYISARRVPDENNHQIMFTGLSIAG